MFFLLQFSVHFICYVYILSVLTVIFHREFLFWSSLFGILCTFCICMGVSFLNLGKFFFCNLVDYLVYAIDFGFISLIHVCNLKVCFFFIVVQARNMGAFTKFGTKVGGVMEEPIG